MSVNQRFFIFLIYFLIDVFLTFINFFITNITGLLIPIFLISALIFHADIKNMVHKKDVLSGKRKTIIFSLIQTHH